jgi:DNA-binding Lrp family transcriptional regulator
MANAVRAYIFIECNVGSTREVIEGLKHFKGIKSVETVTGPYDIIAILELESLQEIGDLVTQNVQKVNGITRTVTCIAL